MTRLGVSLDDQCAIIESYRRFAAYLIVSSIAIVQNKRSAVSSFYDAWCFLQSDECVCLVRLLIGLDSLSDAEITRMLIDAQMRKQ